MNNEEQVLLKLIKKSQFAISEPIDWASVDMDALYKEAMSQSVLCLISSVIPSEYSNPKWMEAQYRQKSSYIRYCHAQDELKTVLDNSSVPFVILKGNASAISYKEPSERMMGDIDFLVLPEDFDKAYDVLCSNGYVIDHDTDRHVAFNKDKTLFELHNRFSHDVDIEEYMIYGIKNREIVSIDGHEFPMMPKLANGLVLLDHMRGHIKSAIGLRHIIDWMMYVFRNLDDDFWNNEFKAVAEEKGMATFAMTVTRMCQIYLGLPETITWCKDADKNVCEQLLNVVLSSGNFGRKNEKGTNVETVSTSIKRKGLFHWLQYAGERNWKAYQKHHWLKPFCWLYQIFRYAKQGFKSGRNNKQLKADLDRSKERYELLKKLGID